MLWIIIYPCCRFSMFVSLCWSHSFMFSPPGAPHHGPGSYRCILHLLGHRFQSSSKGDADYLLSHLQPSALESIPSSFFFSSQWTVAKILTDWTVVLDLLVIFCGFAELLVSAMVQGDPLNGINVVRVLRLGRILRLTRFLRKLRTLRELHKLAYDDGNLCQDPGMVISPLLYGHDCMEHVDGRDRQPFAPAIARAKPRFWWVRNALSEIHDFCHGSKFVAIPDCHCRWGQFSHSDCFISLRNFSLFYTDCKYL